MSSRWHTTLRCLRAASSRVTHYTVTWSDGLQQGLRSSSAPATDTLIPAVESGLRVEHVDSSADIMIVAAGMGEAST